MKYLQSFRDVLNPIDRTSEILFGLIMAMTILGTISIANTGQQDVRMALVAVLGCNLAWGMVDGVMYLVRTLTGRARNIHLARCVQSADAPTGQQLLRDALPEEIAALAGSNELEAMRQRLLAVPADTVKTLRPDDYIAACAIFLLVLLTSVPLALPFLLIADIQTAMRMYRIVSLFMLFGCGMAFARYAGHARPARVGFAMMVLGSVLTLVIIALGG